jgi:hypothetical protein
MQLLIACDGQLHSFGQGGQVEVCPDLHKVCVHSLAISLL